MKQHASHIWALTITSLLAGFLVAYWLVVLPEMRKVVAAQAVLEANAMLGAGKALPGGLSKSDEEVLLAKVNTLLPESDLQYDLAIQVEALANAAEVTLAALGITRAVPGAGTVTSAAGAGSVRLEAGVQRVTLSVSVEGDFAAIERFVTGLQRLERFITIDQISVSQASSSTGEATPGQLAAQVTAFAYYMPVAAATPSPVPVSASPAE